MENFTNNELANTKVDYIEFTELNYFYSTFEINKALKNIKSYLNNMNADWFCQFESLNDLRKINKFQPELFLEVFMEIILEYPKLIISIRSNIAKLALIVLKEFFSNPVYFTKNFENNNYNFSNSNKFGLNNNIIYTNNDVENSQFLTTQYLITPQKPRNNINFINNLQNSASSNYTQINSNFGDVQYFAVSNNQIHKIFDAVVPMILQQSCSMKAFLKEEALKCLENISKNTFNLYFLKKLIAQINNKNNSYCENAYNTANKLLEKIFGCNSGSNEYLVYEFIEFSNEKKVLAIKEVMEHIISLYNLKKDIYAKKAVKLMNTLKEAMVEIFFNSAKALFDNVSKATIENMLKDSNKLAKTTGNIKEFLTTKRK